jgi:hypothetical protein
LFAAVTTPRYDGSANTAPPPGHRGTQKSENSGDDRGDARRAVDEVAAFIRYATTVQDEISA